MRFGYGLVVLFGYSLVIHEGGLKSVVGESLRYICLSRNRKLPILTLKNILSPEELASGYRSLTLRGVHNRQFGLQLHTRNGWRERQLIGQS
jgi:hypothetical protein